MTRFGDKLCDTLFQELAAREKQELKLASRRQEKEKVRRVRAEKEARIQTRCMRLYLDSFVTKNTNKGVHFRNGDAGFRIWNRSTGHPAPRMHGGRNGVMGADGQRVKEYIDWLRMSGDRDERDVEYQGRVLKRYIRAHDAPPQSPRVGQDLVVDKTYKGMSVKCDAAGVG